MKSNLELRRVLQNIHVPYDLLELMDYTNINPDLYTHGLVTETTQQLVGLQRRKNALHLLIATIEKRLNDDDDRKREHPPAAIADLASVADSIQRTQTSSTRLPVVTENNTYGSIWSRYGQLDGSSQSESQY